MELKIRNFAKILEADIEIDGITIIAGNNNLGKSTIGKILDAVFNATYNITFQMYPCSEGTGFFRNYPFLPFYIIGNIV